MPSETVVQSKYEEIPLPEKKEDEFQGVYSYNAYVEKSEKDDSDKGDEIQLVEIIKRLVGNENYLIRAENDIDPRPIKYSDIMVISAKKRINLRI